MFTSYVWKIPLKVSVRPYRMTLSARHRKILIVLVLIIFGGFIEEKNEKYLNVCFGGETCINETLHDKTICPWKSSKYHLLHVMCNISKANKPLCTTRF